MTTPLADSRDGLAASDDVATPSDDTLLTIGELSEHTGISTQLLRTWETRFGFPEPTRLPSGHRRYTGADVRAVRRVLEERDRGTRLEQAIGVARRAEDATAERLGLRVAEPAASRADVVRAHEEHPARPVVGDRGRGDRPGRPGRARGDLPARSTTSGSPPSAGRTSRAPPAVRWRWRTSRSTTTTPVRRRSRCPRTRRCCGSGSWSTTPRPSPLRWWRGSCPDRATSATPTATSRRSGPSRAGSSETSPSSAPRPPSAEGSGAARDLLRLLEESSAPPVTSQRSATAVFNRMVAYTDGTTLRTRPR